MKTYTVCQNCSQLNRVSFDPPDGKAPICGKCKTELNVKGGISELTASGLADLIRKSPVPVIVDMWAPWCAPCRSFAPVYERAARLLGEATVLAKVNTEANPVAGQLYQVRGIPTLIAFRGGREVARESGAMPLDMFMSWARKAASQA